MKNFLKILQATAISLLLLAPMFLVATNAATLPQPTIPIEGGKALDLNDITKIIQEIATFLIVIGTIIAVIYIIIGGISYMAAGGDSAKATKATERIKNGIIGAAVVLGVGLILRTVAGVVQRGSLS